MPELQNVVYQTGNEFSDKPPLVQRERMGSDLEANAINALRTRAGFPPHDAEEKLMNRQKASEDQIVKIDKFITRYETDIELTHKKIDTHKKRGAIQDAEYADAELKKYLDTVSGLKAEKEREEATVERCKEELKKLRKFYKDHPVPLHLQYPPHTLPENERVDSSMLDPSLWS